MLRTLILTTISAMAVSTLQAKECAPGDDIDISAEGGYVTAKADGKEYRIPVPSEIKKLNCAILGIGPMFSTQIVLPKEGAKTVKAIKEFYTGKKIQGRKLGKFKRTEIAPGVFAQQSRACKGKKGTIVELDETATCENSQVEGAQCLTIKIFPQCK